jgi:hypothetical protein
MWGGGGEDRAHISTIILYEGLRGEGRGPYFNNDFVCGAGGGCFAFAGVRASADIEKEILYKM